MLRRKPLSFIQFGNDWKAENKTSSHHIAEEISKHHRLIYVECPGLRAPRGSKRDLRKIFSKLRIAFSKPRVIHDKLSVLTLLQIPFHKFKFIRAVNRWLTVFQVKRICHSFQIKDPIIWLMVPHLPFVCQHVKNCFSVYYCTDDYSAFPGVDEKAVRAMDELTTRKVDFVVTVSNPLFEKKRLLNSNIITNEHGVDFNHFFRVYKRDVLLAEQLAVLPRPIVGFFGLIENWIDLDLIAYLAKTEPGWSFVLIGQNSQLGHEVFALTNVFHFGQQPFAKLPGFALGFDVAILPYKHNRQIENCNPIKLREYLATGKPIVSVRFPEAEKFSDLIEIADDYPQFRDKIAYSLQHDSSEKARARVEHVKPLTWENKINGVLEKVYQQLS